MSIKLKGISPKTGYALTAEDRAKGAVNGAAAKVRKNRELTLSLPFKELYSRKAKKKRIIFEQTGCCEICGSHEWLGKPIPLELDHIDGNKENEERNNLRCICPNCHSFTPTYKGKNVKVRGRVGKVYEGVLKTPA